MKCIKDMFSGGTINMMLAVFSMFAFFATFLIAIGLEDTHWQFLAICFLINTWGNAFAAALIERENK
jgi:hypothetical protein